MNIPLVRLQSLDGSLDKIFAGVISSLAIAISDLDAGPSRRLTAISMLRQFRFVATVGRGAGELST